MKKLIPILALITLGVAAEPEFSSWMVNCDGSTGYHNIFADVELVRYNANNVYVDSTGIPSHPIGPWQGNPNDATEQDHLFRIPRSPQPASNNLATPLGPIGVFVNGVPMFNAEDGFSWNMQGVWHRNAIIAEAISFDSCSGHPQNQGVYHYHQQPECLRVQLGDDGSTHSPIIGWAFDGYPVYGPHGYDDPQDANSSVRRMVTGYDPRTGMVQRDSLPDGTQLPPHLWGPNVSNQWPLGVFIEDFAFNGTGDLDPYNGRTCVTPDYPAGTYAYFTTLDAQGNSAFPYIIGIEYFGVPDTANFGMGNVNVPPGADTYEACTPPPSNYCTTSPNSVGSGAVMSWSGSTGLAANDLTLLSLNCPPGEFGIFFYGPDQANVPLGDGTLCVGPGGLGLFRLPVVKSSIFGITSYTLDYTQSPLNSGNGQVMVGTVMNFQHWYRDGGSTGAGYNLSDGLQVTFGA